MIRTDSRQDNLGHFVYAIGKNSPAENSVEISTTVDKDIVDEEDMVLTSTSASSTDIGSSASTTQDDDRENMSKVALYPNVYGIQAYISKLPIQEQIIVDLSSIKSLIAEVMRAK